MKSRPPIDPIPKVFMKPTLKKILLISTVLPVALASSMAMASITTFANFADKTSSKSFSFTNNTTTTSASFWALMDPVTFSYTSLNVDPALQGTLNAHLTMTPSTSTTTTAFYENRTYNDFQAIDGITTIKFALDSPYKGKTNLLTVIFSGGSHNVYLGGSDGSTVVGLTADSGAHQNVTYTSDFLNFGNVSSKSFALSFSGQSVSTGINSADSLLNSFDTDGAGTFSADPAPTITVISEPESSTMLVAGLGLMGFVSRRRKC